MAESLQVKPEIENQIREDIASFYGDPVAFVEYAFPWGMAGTALADQTGMDTWQRDVMADIAGGVCQNVGEAIQIAISSGHGIGKSALVAWIILWFVSTRPHPQIVVTANTQTQLTAKTWRELAKWHKLAINSHWFKWTATRFYMLDHIETWFASAIPWSENNSEAFAGTHERHVLILFDEASAIADIIWEVTEGAMTTPGAIWICFGNPTQNTGRFFQCFNRFRHRWIHRQIDSRTAKMADRTKLDQWVDDYGEDSDFVRVRVRGVFPRQAVNQLISLEDVANARRRESISWQHSPVVMGIDVAREGDDQSVILLRQGPKVHWVKRYRLPNLMQFSSRVSQEILALDEKADGIFVDGTGMGAGVVDRLQQLGHDVIPVMVGSKDMMKPEKYFNVRAEIWGNMKDWFMGEVDIPDDQELEDDLIGVQYGFDQKECIQLEKKSDMKRRGLASPDAGDALALTFFAPVARKFSRKRRRRSNWRA